MLAAGVLWPGLQGAETIKERRSLYERDQSSRQLDRIPELEQDKQKDWRAWRACEVEETRNLQREEEGLQVQSLRSLYSK